MTVTGYEWLVEGENTDRRAARGDPPTQEVAKKDFNKQDKAIKIWFLCRTFLSLKSLLANDPITE